MIGATWHSTCILTRIRSGASLKKHNRPAPDASGPSWLTFIGHTKDSLWSIDLLHCESILLETHRVLLVMAQFTRCNVGVGVYTGDVDGAASCQMLNSAISTSCAPKHISSGNDPLFLYHQWQENLRILGVDVIKGAPYMPVSHPYIERLFGPIRVSILITPSF